MTLFQRIIDREIPATIVYENDEVLAFRDIHPQAPVHILVIPKKPLRMLSAMGEGDAALVGRLFWHATEVARQEKLEDYRLVVNNGERAGQTVFHLHLHILAGRPFSWPPG